MNTGTVAGDYDLCGSDCATNSGIIRVRNQSEQILCSCIAGLADGNRLFVTASFPFCRPAASHQAGDKRNIVVFTFFTDTEVICVAVFLKDRACFRHSGIIIFAVTTVRHFCAGSRVPVNGRTVLIDDQGLTRRTGTHTAAKAARSVIRDQRIGDRQKAILLHENTAAAPVICGKRFVIGNIYLLIGCSNHAVGTAADTKAAALAIFGAVAGNGAAAHCKTDSTFACIEARINAAPCQTGIVAGNIAAGHVHGRTVRQGNTATAVFIVLITLAAATFAIFVVVGHIATGQIQRTTAFDEDTAAVVRISIVDPVARHRTAGDVQRTTAADEDTAAGTATVGRNNTVLDIHRSVVNVNTAAGRAVTAAAHNIAAIYVQRSAVHDDYMLAAGVLEYTAP